MLCDRCKTNPANYHYTQVLNGQRTETHLCQDCLNAQTGASLEGGGNLFSAMLGGQPKAEPLHCSLCGLEYSRFQQTGLLGCAQCYNDFRPQLEPMLRRIHGHVQHQGHVPASASEAIKARRRIDALQDEMKQAVQSEDFERAAQVRDMLRSAQKELEALQHPFGGKNQQEESSS